MAARDMRNEAGLSLGDIYGVLRRRSGWFLIPTAIGVVASLVLALALPAEYEAAATVTVEPPVIPDKLAPNTIGSDTETRYENLKRQRLLSLQNARMLKTLPSYNAWEIGLIL